jgi:F0F1-type ATP synthase assembly protein I
MADKGKDYDNRKKILIQITGVGLSVGSELTICVLIGLYLGNFIDQKFSIAPFGTLISILFFMSASLFHIVIVLINFQKKLKKIRNEKSLN